LSEFWVPESLDFASRCWLWHAAIPQRASPFEHW
jgi:hypothetical protein